MNRVGNLPRLAKVRGGFNVEARPLLGIGYVCEGVRSVIPPGEVDKMTYLLDDGMKHSPLLVMFTGGEEALFPGIGYKHANLSTGFVVIGDAP